jgi:putative transposase
MKKTFNIYIKDKKNKDKLLSYIFKYKHFENVYLLFIEKSENIDFNVITNYKIMRSVLINTTGGNNINNINKINHIRNKYKDNEFLILLKELSKKLKIHNICLLIKRIRTSYKIFFTKIKKGVKSSIPKASKLKLLSKYSIQLDQIAWSLKRKNILGINLFDKMFYIHIDFKNLNNICGSIKNITSILIKYSNKQIYICFTYEYNKININISNNEKFAGLDLGINNLASIFIDDNSSKSIIVDGKKIKQYNSNFNRFNSKLNESISKETIENGKK